MIYVMIYLIHKRTILVAIQYRSKHLLPRPNPQRKQTYISKVRFSHTERLLMNNLELYKTFYYVAKAGSITAAAQQLSLTQPAVSQSMKQLEAQLNVSLFQRTAKGIRLTKEGEILFPYAESCCESIRQGEQKLKELMNLDLGEIRIGASDMTLKFYLLPFLEQFHRRYPKIKVIVSNSPTPETLTALSENRIDLGVVSSPLPAQFQVNTAFDISDTPDQLSSHRNITSASSNLILSNGFVAHKVREIQDIFVAASRFWELKNKQLSYEMLEQLPVICLEKNTSTRKYMDTFLAQNHVALAPEFELSTSDMIVQFALRNLGIGCVMKDFALEALESGELFELCFTPVMPPRSFYLIHRETNALAPAARKFITLFP